MHFSQNGAHWEALFLLLNLPTEQVTALLPWDVSKAPRRDWPCSSPSFLSPGGPQGDGAYAFPLHWLLGRHLELCATMVAVKVCGKGSLLCASPVP